MTATTAGPPVAIDGPLPVAPPFNLLTVAQEAPVEVSSSGDFTNRWLNGATVFTYPDPNDANGVDPCAADDSFGTKDEGGDLELPVFGSFTGYQPVKCTAFAMQWDEFTRRANIALQAAEPRLLEKQLVAGRFKMDNPFLGDTNADLVDGGITTAPVAALEQLEQAIGESGQGGVIHADPATVVSWSAHNLLVERRGQLQTIGGTPVARGVGYIDAFPLAVGPISPAITDQSWAWATGPVEYQRGQMYATPDSLGQAMERDNNKVVYRAERDLLVAWDTRLQVGVLVDRSL